MVCLLAVAFVASFHLCKLGGTTRYEFSSVLAANVADDSSSEPNPVTAEVCHVCTVVAVSEISIVKHSDGGSVPSPRVTPLVSVSPKNIGPPPKA